MEPKAHYIMIGAFAIAVSLALFIFIVWLGKYAIDRDFDYYDIIFAEAVTGLGERGAVMFNGIPVGEVIELKVDPENPSRVITRVRIVQGTPVGADTRALLGFMGFTGQAYIDMKGGSPDAPILKQGGQDEVPIIYAETSELQSILNSGGSLFANINDLILRLNELITNETMASIEHSIKNIEQLTTNLADNGYNIDATISNISSASKSMDITMRRLDQLSDEWLTYWQQHGESLSEDLAASGTDMRATAEHARAFAAKLRALLERNAGAVDEFASDGMSQVGPALKEVRSLVRRLEALVRKLEDNPANFILSGENVREFRPSEQ